jgi:hypothetical protein
LISNGMNRGRGDGYKEFHATSELPNAGGSGSWIRWIKQAIVGIAPGSNHHLFQLSRPRLSRSLFRESSGSFPHLKGCFRHRTHSFRSQIKQTRLCLTSIPPGLMEFQELVRKPVRR